MAYIELSDVVKAYPVGADIPPVMALRGVTMNIDKGESVCIVGRSGSGKSTLLNMLAGLEKPSSGNIVIDGQHLEKMNESRLVQFRLENIGFVFQSYNLMPALTVLENVSMPLTFRGIPRAKRVEKARQALSAVGLEGYEKRKPNQLSGGQQQRVGIARALVADPEIIFADEPTGNLDTNTSGAVMDLIHENVNERGCTLIMVTHDMDMTDRCDRIIRLSDGMVVDEEEMKI